MNLLVGLLREYADECAAISGVDSRALTVADRHIALRFVGNRWSDLLTRAVRHLSIPESHPRSCRPGLTVQLWDGSIQPRSWILRAYLRTLIECWYEYLGPRGELRGLEDAPVRAFYHPGPDLLSVIDLEGNAAYYWKRDLKPPPYYEVGSPMRTLLHAWMRTQNVQFVHAAAIGTPAGGVLLAGKGGSGKSTSALACLGSTLSYAGDDYCMVSMDGDKASVHSLYNTAKLSGDADLARFPALIPWVWNQNRQAGEKATIFLYDHAPELLIREFSLRAIVLPVVHSGERARVEPCTAREALFALAPSTMAQLPASGNQDLSFAAKLVRQTPCYKLFAGSDLATIPGAITHLLDSLQAASAGEREHYLQAV